MGNPVELSMLELAEKVLQLIGGKSKLVHHPLPVDDPKQRQPDITLAREQLAWNPQVPLQDGLKETVNYVKQLFAKQ